MGKGQASAGPRSARQGSRLKPRTGRDEAREGGRGHGARGPRSGLGKVFKMYMGMGEEFLREPVFCFIYFLIFGYAGYSLLQAGFL